MASYLESPDTVCLPVQIPDVAIDTSIFCSDQDNAAEATPCTGHLTYPHSCCALWLCALQLCHRSDLDTAGELCEVAASDGCHCGVAWQVQHKPSGSAGQQCTVDSNDLDVWPGLVTCSNRQACTISHTDQACFEVITAPPSVWCKRCCRENPAKPVNCGQPYCLVCRIDQAVLRVNCTASAAACIAGYSGA